MFLTFTAFQDLDMLFKFMLLTDCYSISLIRKLVITQFCEIQSLMIYFFGFDSKSGYWIPFLVYYILLVTDSRILDTVF